VTHAKPNVVFVLGGPGSGKGTQCQQIVKELGWVHLSAGDLLRAEEQSGSDVGNMIGQYIREGKLVPGECIFQALKNAMEKEGWAQKQFLIDGFPRNMDSLAAWNTGFGDKVNMKFCALL